MLAVLAELRAALGDEVVQDANELAPRFTNDWAGMPPQLGIAVVRPRSTEEVSQALAICHAHNQSVVPQGGLTGVSGAGRPRPGDLCLSLDRMSGVEEIDTAMATMTVKAGTTLQAVQEAAAAEGLYCPLDLGARGSCAIGGNINTNAGGNRVIRFGMTREMVLGLEVVLADGTVVSSLNKLIKNNAGYDLKHWFIGAEGTLGVVTRAVLRLRPMPLSRSCAVIGLEDFAATQALLEAARRGLGDQLSAFEVMWPEYYDLMVDHEPSVRAPLEGRYGMYVLLEAQGFDRDHDPQRFAGFLEAMFEAGTIADAALAQSEGDVSAFWGLRDAVSEFKSLIGPHLAYDVGLPVRSMPGYVDGLRQALESRLEGAILIVYGHMGDGNLHLQVSRADRGVPDKDIVDSLVYGQLAPYRGTITAEHGLGTLKRDYLDRCRSAEEIALMERIKHALDPKAILNPGKSLSGMSVID